MSSVLAWVVAHEVVLASAVVAVLDLVFALNPNSSSNGILHWIYVQLQSLLGKPSGS